MSARAAIVAETLAWLETRPAAPAALAERVRAAVAEVRADVAEHGAGAEHSAGVDRVASTVHPLSISGLLAEAGLDRLRSALALARAAADPTAAGDRPPPRAAALDLLAADALITYAFEAAAGESAEAVDALAAAYGPGRFATLLDGDVSDGSWSANHEK